MCTIKECYVCKSYIGLKLIKDNNYYRCNNCGSNLSFNKNTLILLDIFYRNYLINVDLTKNLTTIYSYQDLIYIQVTSILKDYSEEYVNYYYKKYLEMEILS